MLLWFVCVSMLFIQAVGSVSDNKLTVSKYVEFLQQKDFSSALALANENVKLSWEGAHNLFDNKSEGSALSGFDTDGPWVNKTEVSRFYQAYYSSFNALFVDNVTIVCAEANTVIVRLIQHLQFALHAPIIDLTTLQVFKFGSESGSQTNSSSSVIIKIEMVLDSTEMIFSQCSEHGVGSADSMRLACMNNVVSGVARVSDVVPQTPLPSVLNSNTTLNKQQAFAYLEGLNEADAASAFSVLSEDVFLTWHGSTRNFPSMGGTWVNKSQLQRFYATGTLLTKPFSVEAINIIAAENNFVFGEFWERNYVLGSSTSYSAKSSVIFTFGDNGMIVGLEVFLDTSVVLRSTLCTSRDFTAYPLTCTVDLSMTAVKNFLGFLAEDNITASLDLLHPNSTLIWEGQSVSELSGIYEGKVNVEKFFHTRNVLFDKMTMSNFNYLLTTSSSIVVQFIETGVTTTTGRPYNLISTWIFEGTNTIKQVSIYVDSLTKLLSLRCNENVPVVMYCDKKSLPLSPVNYTDDKRSARPLASAKNSNITLNMEVASRFLQATRDASIDPSTLVFDTTSFTYRAPLSLFPTLGGTWTGKSRIKQFFANRLALFSPDSPSSTPTLIAQNNVVVATCSQSWRVYGYASFSLNTLVIFTMGDDGKLADIEMWEDSAALLHAVKCPHNRQKWLVCASPPTTAPASSSSSRDTLFVAGGVTLFILALFGSVYYYRWHKRQNELREGLLKIELSLN